MESGSTEIKSKEIQFVKTSELIPYDKNMNKHTPDQIDRLCKLIEYQGFRDPLIVQLGTSRVACGHGRLEKAAKKLGMEEVPVIFQEFESEDQFYAFVVSHNAIAEWSSLDLSQINVDIQDLGPDLDIDMLGLLDFEIEPLDKLDPQTDEDAVPEVEHPITRRGDIWLLGNHRVMCGDSTMIDDVEKLMAGEKADMVFTDPPYGMKLDADYSKMGTSTVKHRNINGDHEDFSEDLINTIFTFDTVKEMFIWGADYFAELLPDKNDGSWLVWDKRSTETEIGKMDGQFGSAFELCWSKSRHKREIIRHTRYTSSYKGDNKPVHPTMKPVEVIEKVFKWWCDNLFKCVDLYLGSGSTLIACEKTNRKCYGMELDEKYCDVIINRWQGYTGKTATLEATGQTYVELKVERDG